MDWNAVVDELGASLYRYFCFHGAGSESADLVQEVFLRLYEKTEKKEFQLEKGTLRQYAFGIALRIRFENRRKSVKLEKMDNSTSLFEELSSKTNLPEPVLKSLWACFDEREREVFGLLIDEELTFLECATLLNLPLGTVKTVVHRARKKIQNILEIENQETHLGGKI